MAKEQTTNQVTDPGNWLEDPGNWRDNPLLSRGVIERATLFYQVRVCEHGVAYVVVSASCIELGIAMHHIGTISNKAEAGDFIQFLYGRLGSLRGSRGADLIRNLMQYLRDTTCGSDGDMSTLEVSGAGNWNCMVGEA